MSSSTLSPPPGLSSNPPISSMSSFNSPQNNGLLPTNNNNNNNTNNNNNGNNNNNWNIFDPSINPPIGEIYDRSNNNRLSYSKNDLLQNIYDVREGVNRLNSNENVKIFNSKEMNNVLINNLNNIEEEIKTTNILLNKSIKIEKKHVNYDDEDYDDDDDGIDYKNNKFSNKNIKESRHIRIKRFVCNDPTVLCLFIFAIFFLFLMYFARFYTGSYFSCGSYCGSGQPEPRNSCQNNDCYNKPDQHVIKVITTNVQPPKCNQTQQNTVVKG